MGDEENACLFNNQTDPCEFDKNAEKWDNC